jgi:hypothetical protein
VNFRQCADISIEIYNDLEPMPGRRFYGLVSNGIHADNGQLASVEINGQVSLSGPAVNTNVRSQPQTGKGSSSMYLSDGVVAPYTLKSGQSGLIYSGGTLASRTVAAPQSLFFWDKTSESLTLLQSNLSLPGARQLCTILNAQNSVLKAGSMLAIGQTWPNSDGQYSFLIYVFNAEGKPFPKLIATTPLTDVYVNFFWATFNPMDGTLYFLSGHENEGITLDTTIYTISVLTSAVSNVTLVRPTYTFDHIHIDTTTGLLLSLSQGPLNGPKWSLVSTDPFSGEQSWIGSIPNSANFDSNYGGAVHGGLTQEILWHTFKNVLTDGLELVAVGIRTGNINYQTQIDIGLNAERSFSDLIFI